MFSTHESGVNLRYDWRIQQLKTLKDMLENLVLGGIPETTELLSKPWSKVVFTGSGRVGRIVAESCARTLSPCLLELGGKCPLVVDETVPQSDLRSVAERIVFGKFANAGQTCLAVDTVFVHESHIDRLSESLLAALSKQFGNNPQTDGELGRIVNKKETQRILDYLLEVEKEQDSASSSFGNQRGPVVLCGGSSRCDVNERYIDPTIVLLPANSTTRLAREEIFGPVLPIIAFSNRNEAIQNIQSLNGIPLQLYVFTPSKRIYQEYTDKCRSAGSVRNDCLAQGASSVFPLGG